MLPIELWVVPGTVIARADLSGSLWIKITNLSIFFLYVEDNATFVCYLRNLWVSEKIRSKFSKPWEIKKLPWDLRKAVKQSETRETVRIERSVVKAFEFEFSLIFLALTFFPVSIVLLPKIGSHHLINLWINIFDSDLEVHFRLTLFMFLSLFWLSMKFEFAIQKFIYKIFFCLLSRFSFLIVIPATNTLVFPLCIPKVKLTMSAVHFFYLLINLLSSFKFRDFSVP